MGYVFLLCSACSHCGIWTIRKWFSSPVDSTLGQGEVSSAQSRQQIAHEPRQYHDHCEGFDTKLFQELRKVWEHMLEPVSNTDPVR